MIMTIDPVCHVEVEEAPALHAEKDGTVYYFCCEQCRQKFLSPPVLLSVGRVGSAGTRERESAGALPRSRAPALPRSYICPMHPEVEQDHPGVCPKCGMALEAKTVSAEADDDDGELRDMTRRFQVAAVLAFAVLLLALLPMLWLTLGLDHQGSHWFQFILSTPVVLWAGWPFFQRGWQSLVNRMLNLFTPIALRPGAAYLSSGIALLFPHQLPAACLPCYV